MEDEEVVRAAVPKISEASDDRILTVHGRERFRASATHSNWPLAFERPAKTVSVDLILLGLNRQIRPKSGDLAIPGSDFGSTESVNRWLESR